MQGNDIDVERIIPILEGLRRLLLKHHLSQNAAFVGELLDLAHAQSPALVEKLQGGRVWGKGLADVAFAEQIAGPEEQLRRDELEFRRLLLSLADEMTSQGISSEGSVFIADLFREGL